jgi:hypothetical protein
MRQIVAVLRLVAAILAICAPLQLIPTTFAAWGLCYGVPLAWLFALPLHDASKSAATRVWIALVLVFQSLQAYPVAGSQLNWGTCLWVSLMALGLHDAAPVLRGMTGKLGAWPARVGVACILFVTLFMTRQLVRIGWHQYSSSQPLGLVGAENLRLPNDITYALRAIDENLRTHADMLFSFPGLYSANHWTGLPTPTLSNATHWFSLLSNERQQQIIDVLATTPRAALLVQRELLDYLARHGFSQQGLLHSWLLANFEEAISCGGYEIWVHRGRTIAPLSLARTDATSDGPLTALTLTIGKTRRPVAQIDLCNIDVPDTSLFPFVLPQSTLEIAPCDLTGKVTSSFKPVTYPFDLAELSEIRLTFQPLNVGTNLNRFLVVLRDSDGEVVAEMPVIK